MIFLQRGEIPNRLEWILINCFLFRGPYNPSPTVQ